MEIDIASLIPIFILSACCCYSMYKVNYCFDKAEKIIDNMGNYNLDNKFGFK